jgi:hypothetical protein
VAQMQVTKKSDGWWIVNVPDTVTECGPYDTRAEAEDDRRGLERTFRMLDKKDKERKARS